MTDREVIFNYLLILGDNSMVLGHRLSELCGHGPSLETDIACTNISLDLFGQVRSYFQYAGSLLSPPKTEDDLAYWRGEREFRNCILVEQPNIDFAHVIVRQFLFDAFHVPMLTSLSSQSGDETIRAIATKSLKEAKYHLIFSSEWMKRLGDGTKESNQKMQSALNTLFPFVHELGRPTIVEKKAYEQGIGTDHKIIKEIADTTIAEIITDSSLIMPELPERFAKGKEGLHSEHLGYILAEFQSTQKAYPNMTW